MNIVRNNKVMLNILTHTLIGCTYRLKNMVFLSIRIILPLVLLQMVWWLVHVVEKAYVKSKYVECSNWIQIFWLIYIMHFYYIFIVPILSQAGVHQRVNYRYALLVCRKPWWLPVKA